MYHRAVRTSVLVIASLLALACADQPSQDESAALRSASSQVAGQVEQPARASAPEVAQAPALALDSADPEQAIAEPQPELSPTEAEAPAEAESQPQTEPAPPEPAPSEPGDPLAPILPSAPEPGSPEADAELAELLEESTITQEEFDAAFRGRKPKIDGDQLVFGHGDRTRKRPVVSVGKPTIEHSKLAASEISALAKAHLRGFEGCLAVALSDNPAIEGSVSVRVRFDAKGESSEATIEGGAALGDPLRKCLAAVADNWSLAEAAGASVSVPLTLASE